MANVIKHKRGSGSDPSASDLVVGEVAIRTDVGKLFTKMDNGSVAEIAGGGSDIAINTLSSSSATGGGSATFNGSAYRFTLSAPPSVSAQQLLVSINGVIQKPVAGTGQPSEGFSVDGTDIILGDAPATGSDFFILTFKSLGVSEPADNSVTSAKIVDGAIVNADINASAAIAGTKISPDFGSQDVVTTGNITSGGTLKTTGNVLTVEGATPRLNLTDTNNNSDFEIGNTNGTLNIADSTNSVNRLRVLSNGTVIVTGNLDAEGGIDVTGAITGTGDLTIDTNTLHVDSSNNRVGIGTTSPIQTLDVTGSNGVGIAEFTNTATSFSNDCYTVKIDSSAHTSNMTSAGAFAVDVNAGRAMTINGNGDVGIGTSSPTDKLHVVGDVEFTLGTNVFDVMTTGSGSKHPIRLLNADASAGNEVGIQFGPANNVVGASIQGIAESDFTSSANRDGALSFTTRLNGTLSEAMRIDSSGRLLVGSSSISNNGKIQGFIAHGSTAGESGITSVDTTAMAAGVGGEISFMGKTNTSGDYNYVGHVRGIKENATSGNTACALTFHTRPTLTAPQERMRIDSAGRVFIGTTSGSERLKVETTANTMVPMTINDSSNTSTLTHRILFSTGGTEVGRIRCTNSGTQYNTSGSDRSMKKNFELWDEDVLSLFKNINPQKFNFIQEKDGATKSKGFIAQELANSFPEAYSKGEEEDDKYWFNPSGMVVYLMKALQEAVARIEALEAK